MQPLKSLFRISYNITVFFLLAKLYQFKIVVKIALKLFERREGMFQSLALAHEFLRFLGIIPEAGRFRLPVQLAQAFAGASRVKDASLAAPATA